MGKVPFVRPAILAVTFLATAAGCSAESPESPERSAGPATVTVRNESPWYSPPVAFEQLDPCSLVAAAEVAALTGQQTTEAARNRGLEPDMSIAGKADMCEWGAAPAPLSVMLWANDDSTGNVEQQSNPVSEWMAGQLGHPANLTYDLFQGQDGDGSEVAVEDCTAFVGFGAHRSVRVGLQARRPLDTAEPTDTENLCQRYRDTIHMIYSRVPWK